MKTNDVIHGFSVERVRESKELCGTLYELRHKKTGAQLVWLNNKEDNKLFSIAFKTLPWDDTGVFHILEHSVLCGSENFPVKEPFLDLIKGSMNTFLNAMTFNDKTMYPVSSRNEQDFLNLTRVYLDAVFNPLIYKNPSIFYQEGWHFELDENGDASFKGVVYNEMKGAYSSVDSMLNEEITTMLFPDSCYGFDSGGDPEYIPDLSYERFIAAHAEFYHPTNSKIYLDGDVPFEKTLELIDSYLNKYEKSDKTHVITPQAPVEGKVKVEYYDAGKDEDLKNKAFIAYGKILCGYSDRKKILASQVISDYLTDSNEAPLKRAIIGGGLAQDVDIYIDDSVYEPYIVMTVRNTELHNREEINAVIKKTVTDIIKAGVDKDELSAVINRLEFKMKEPNEPQGLIRNINALNSWLHDDDPMIWLENDSIIAELRAALDTDYYAELMNEIFVDDAYTAQLCMLPSATKGEETREIERMRLQKSQDSWTENDRADIAEKNEKLIKWQREPDSDEAKATLPVLSLSDVGEEPFWTQTQETEYNSVKVLFHPVATNGVVHCRLYFSLTDQPIKALSQLSFLTDLFGELPTAKHTASELQKEIKRVIGAIDYTVATYASKQDTNACKPMFVVRFSTLEHNLTAAIDLICEILLDTVYDDREMIKNILLQSKEAMYQSMITAGSRFAVRRAAANFLIESAIAEQTEGYDFYRQLVTFADDFDSRIDDFCGFASSVKDNIFTASRLMISETSTEPHNAVKTLADKFSHAAAETPEYLHIALKNEPKKEAVKIPSGVSYAASCGSAACYGAEFDGKLLVLSNILTFGYYWGEIRVHGGAYGCGFRAGELGGLMSNSYRDPSPIRSLGIFDNTPNFIREFVASDEDTDRFIISTIAGTEPLISPSERGAAADANFLRGITYEDRLNMRREMLSLKKDDLLAFCELFEKMAKGNAVCIFGSPAALDSLGSDWKVYQL